MQVTGDHDKLQSRSRGIKKNYLVAFCTAHASGMEDLVIQHAFLHKVHVLTTFGTDKLYSRDHLQEKRTMG